MNQFFKKHIFLLVAVLLAVLLYGQSVSFEFLNWDDQTYVTANPIFKGHSDYNLFSHFTEFHMGNYHPLTMISLHIDNLVSGGNAGYFHFVNVLLHLVNCVLLYFFLLKLDILKKEVVGVTTILFAVLAIHVEAVAWISSRKDLLYTAFLLAALLSYTKHVAENKLKFLWLSVLFFVLSALSKAQAVSFALIVPAIDWLLNRKFDKKVIAEKAGFVALALIVGVLAIKAQSSAVNESLFATLPQRIILASYALGIYILKTLVPFSQAAFYPYPMAFGEPIPSTYYLSILVPLVLLFLLYFFIKKNEKIAAFGLMVFLFSIAPLLQIFHSSEAIVSERYVYYASIGVLVFVVYLLQNKTKQKLFYVLTGLLFLLNAVQAYRYLLNWETSEKLWAHTVNVKPSSVACNNLGMALEASFSIVEAQNAYTKALDINPNNEKARFNRAVLYQKATRYSESLKDYNSLLDKKETWQIYYNRGVVYSKLQKYDNAILDFDKAMALTSNVLPILLDKGNVYGQLGEYNMAIQFFEQVINVQPYNIKALISRGISFARIDEYEKALVDFSRVIEYAPNSLNGYFQRAMVFIKIGENTKACADLNRAYKLGDKRAVEYIQKFCK